jgi:hypothetical protein
MLKAMGGHMPIEETVYAMDELQLELVCDKCRSVFPMKKVMKGFGAMDSRGQTLADKCPVCIEDFHGEILRRLVKAFYAFDEARKAMLDLEVRWRFFPQRSAETASQKPESE